MKKLVGALALVGGMLCAHFAAAQTARTVTEGYEDVVKGAQSIGVLGPDLFGEQVNLADGATSFQAVDVSIKTNSGLPMSIGRVLGVNARDYDAYVDAQANGELFGNWRLDVPYMHGTFDRAQGWIVGSGTPQQRCSVAHNYGYAPPSAVGIAFANTYYDPAQFWSGNKIHIPGRGSQDLLRLPAGRPVPTGGPVFYGTTQSEWRVACLPSLKNGPGEGFLVYLDDGTRYHFDWTSRRQVSSIDDTACNQYGCRDDINLHRDEVFLHATRVEDRFGNWISYQYDPANPRRLLSISSSDGASISLTYIAGRVETIQSGSRVWRYLYSDASRGILTGVVQPDGSQWSFSYDRFWDVTRSNSRLFWRECAADAGVMSSDVPLQPGNGGGVTMVHPSGAVGTFRFRKLMHGTANTPGGCYDPDPDRFKDEQVTDMVMAYQVPSLYEKSLSGPGLGTQVWSYHYSPSWSWGWCTDPAVCRSTSQTRVTAPDGVVTRFSFGNDYATNAGLLLESTVEAAGVVERRQTQSYALESTGYPFSGQIGYDPQWRANRYSTERLRPQKATAILQDGVTFSSQVNSFDLFARPLSVTKSSTLGYSRTDTTEYVDHLPKWVMGQVGKTTTDGIVTAETAYDPAIALPVWSKAFGKLQQTLGYYADGTLATVKDGRNLTTTVSDWYRGIPRSIQYPDATTQSAVVDASGWITAVTDENGFQTSYTYDAMGRMASIVHPTADTVAWNTTTQAFAQVATSEYGIPAGHWRQTISTGNGRKETYFDAMWRPLVTREYDAADVAGTQRFTRRAYDAAGRESFVSYPGATDALSTGVRTSYDALDRVTAVAQDSELGVLTTSTVYLTGFQTRTTNPRGKQTTTSYKAYDQPGTDWPVTITHPEGAFTDIARDVFGKPTSVTRRDASSSVGNTLTRRYVYDSFQQLCKTIEPETGSTVMSYDAAGNLAWSASGQALTSTTACQDTSVPLASRTTRSYDDRNRIQSLAFPRGDGDQSWRYTPDGLPEQITTLNDEGSSSAINAFAYNKRRLLTDETLQQPGLYTWQIGYGYNANGHLASHTSPGLTVDYTPNALGQATRAGSYATAVSYFPNGAMAQFAYGNGIVHTLAQNARGLPDRSRDAGAIVVHDDSYDYDANGNVLAVSDGLPGNRGNRDMLYDGLDRLTNTVSPMFSPASYGYDVLDNLRTVKVAGRDHTYVYDASQHLTNVTNTVGGVSVIGLGYDAQGNLANKNGQEYRFDYGNRLREAADKETYRYDGNGRRIQAAHQSLDTIYSLYGQDGVLRYQQDYRKKQASGYVYLNGSLVARVANPTSVTTAPAVSAPASSGSGAYAVTWSTVVGASHYRLEESVDGGAWTQVVDTAGSSWSTSGRPDGSYRYRGRSCHLGCSAYSPVASVAVALVPTGTPTLTAPTYSPDGTYTVSWTGVALASTYELHEQLNGGAWTLLQNIAASGKAISGKSSGTYGYRVRGCNSAGCAPWSATATVTVELPPAAPPVLTVPAQGLNGAYTVTWGTAAGATSYTLEESVNSGTWGVTYSGAAQSKAFSGRAAASYAYRIKACNPAGCSGVSATAAVQVIYPPATAPTISAPSQGLNGAYTVSWTAVGGATDYRLEESANGAAWSLIQNTAALSRALAGKATGNYGYRVSACNAAGCGPISSSISVQVIHPPGTATTPAAPALSSNGAYTVSWSAVSTANSYRLTESANGGAWILVHDATTLSKAISGKATGSYSYRVRACNEAGCGAESGILVVQVTYPPSTAPVLTAPAQNITGAYTVSWTAVATATSYQLEESANGGAWILRYNAAGTSSALSGKAAGSYGYRVKACNAGGCGPVSATATTQVVLAPTAAPVVTTPANVTTSSYTVSWSAVATATSYQVWERVNAGAWVQIVNANVTSQARTGKANASYGYQARGCNAGGCGPWSAIATTVVDVPPPIPAMPVTLYAERYIDESGSVNQIVNDVNWSASTGASRYELQGQFGTNPASIIYSGPDLYYQRTGGGQHTYWVRACNVSGCSGWQGPTSP